MTNPLLTPWTGPFDAPPFDRIKPEHFQPAFEVGIEEQLAEIEAVRSNPNPPSFENTIAALELSGRTLTRVENVFFNLAGADTNDEIRAIERWAAPVLARHGNAIMLDGALFARIDDLFRRSAELGLSLEEARVLERYHTGFTRSGAGLAAEAKARLAAINERAAVLGTQFSQNVLADETSFALVLEKSEDLEGLPAFFLDAAAAAAAERGFPGKHVVTLSRSSIEPFLQFSARRDLRERAWRGWIARGAGGGATDNRAIVAETLALRAERARLLGFQTFADYRLADSMAKTPDAVLELLHSVWDPARRQAIQESAELQTQVQQEGQNFELAPWDWRFYAERRRKAAFDFNESQIKPYLRLDKMIEAAFDTAHRLFGLDFEERPDVRLYHPDAKAWEVKDRAGRHVGLFIGDYFARPSKRSGAWMSAFRTQEKLAGDIRPIIVNVMNFAKAANGPTLLSFDDARTLFHEFGHALHGLLSDVTYPMIAGTAVARDFVEFPSQLYEHWLEEPQVLSRFAVHSQTGEPMPKSLLDRLLAARRFNQAFATVEYTASALVDLEFHRLPDADRLDVMAIQRQVLERIGMPPAIVMRHATPHFTHVFSGEGYSSAYYSYLWSEVLDADGFDAFREAGDIFDAATAERLYRFIYSAGYKQDPAKAYQEFRGRAPKPEALLKQRGLAEKAQ